ncbi:LuxR C-terminal-related transcriptional regulator [Novosphingobium profundi]|uniref:LuxR C-terminal-related transcriptional regulator n=1 Tax=Novosphingobium profundi TaxID=1774954 RepID=UPI001CFEA78B|nr:LuxR C-terminal-related transcriptional regulator [Novosphingobium profundi]
MRIEAELRPASNRSALDKLAKARAPLVVVAAPAGYGKSALLRSYADQLGMRFEGSETRDFGIRILDDGSRLDEARVHALIREGEAQGRVVIATRNLPPVDWLSLQMRGKAQVIDVEDLRLGLHETIGLLGEDASGNSAIARRLHLETAGWPAAALAGAEILRSRDRRSDPTAPFLQGAAGRGFFRTFVEEAVPDDIVAFLARCAVFDILSKDLVELAFGATGADNFLRCRDEYMLFVPSEREGFLALAPVLRRHLTRVHPIPPEDDAAALLASIAWHEAEGLEDLAIDYLLRMDRPEEAAQLLARHAPRIRRQQGDSPKMLGWLERIEQKGALLGHELQLWHVRALAFSMRLDEAEARLERIVPHLGAGADAEQAFAERLRITVAARRGNAALTRQLSQDWLDRWANEDALQAAGVAIMYALAHGYAFDERACRRMLLMARHYSTQSANEAGNIWSMGIEALTELDAGRAQLALDIIERAESHAQIACGRNATVSKMLALISATVQLELNNLDAVKGSLEHGYATSSYGLPRLHIAAQEAMTAYVEHSEGINAALLAVHQDGIHGWFYSHMGQLLGVRMLIRSGRIEEAAARFDAVRDAMACRMDHRMQLDFQGVEAWLCFANGDAGAARELLLPLIDFAELHGQRRWMTSLMLLRAACEWSLGELGIARRCFSRAIAVAASGQLVRTVLDLEWALREMIAHMVVDDQISTQSSRFMVSMMERMGMEPPSDAEDAPVERLTAREAEVLVALDSGMIARDIADRLDVSLCTLKWHIKNIYGKLGVRNRTGAITVARRFGLI